MKDYTIEHSEFSDKVSIIETNDPAHADVINTPIKQLFGNTVANKKAVEDSKEQMESKLRAFKNKISESQAELNKSLEKSMNDIKESNAALGKSINNIADRITFIEKTQQLFDYKMYGEASYVFQRKDLLYALYEYTELSMNDLEINGEALEYLARGNKNIGKGLASIFDIVQKEMLEKLNTIQEVSNNPTVMNVIATSSIAMQAVINSNTAMQTVVNSSTAMQAVAGSSIAMQAVISSNTAMQTVVNSSTAMQAVASSGTAMQAVINSSTAIQAVVNSNTAMQAVAGSSTAIAGICKAEYTAIKEFIKVINNNDDYIKKVYDTVTTSPNFQLVIKQYNDNVSYLNQYCNTINTIILCALGYYSNKDGSTSLYINGEIIKSSIRSAGSNPVAVVKGNCNAVAVPTATFTESNDGYAAIAVYKAI